jgi:hypothetical protein
MTRVRLLAACLVMALCAPPAALGDPWKDESGQRGERWREGRDRRDHRDHDRDRGPRREGWGWGWAPAPFAQPRVPPGHLPPPGECRLWFPDRPPGQQPPPGRC